MVDCRMPKGAWQYPREEADVFVGKKKGKAIPVTGRGGP
jgi:hypothetical protein